MFGNRCPSGVAPQMDLEFGDSTRTRRRMRRTLFASGEVALVAVVVMGATGPAHAVQARQRATTSPHHAFASVQQAVAAGVVNPAVAAAVAHGQGRTVLVTVADPGKAGISADIAVRIRSLRSRLDEAKRGLETSPDASVIHQFAYVPTTVVRVTTGKALLALANSPNVVAVADDVALPMTSMDPQSSTLVRQPQAAAAGYTGSGTYVAVLDTGTDYTRPDFGSCTANFTPSTCRVGDFEDAPSDNSLDDNGHGTNVAGIVAGMAPSARILSMDVMGTDANGAVGALPSAVLGAVNSLISWKNQGYPIVAANMSFGSGTFSGACTDYDGLGSLRAAGILPVVAAGNNAATSGIAQPACVPAALSVGAVYDSSMGSLSWQAGCTDSTTFADKPTCFSQSGPNLKMLAPGSQITAAGITESGTSQATPHVTGAAAVLAAAKPSATVDQIERALMSSGPLVIDRDSRARHRLDVYSALTSLLGSADSTAPVVAKPSFAPLLNGTANTGAIPYRFSWSATDAGGVTAYVAYVKTNTGAWSKLSLAATATAVTLNLAPGNRYQLAVAAKDGTGNWSSYAYGAAFSVANYAESSAYDHYTGSWTQKSWASALGSAYKVTGSLGASVSFTFTGTSFVWVATEATNRGRATVYLDGVSQGTKDLYAANTSARHLVVTWHGASGTHTVKIVNQATSLRPYLDVDSFVITG